MKFTENQAQGDSRPFNLQCRIETAEVLIEKYYELLQKIDEKRLLAFYQISFACFYQKTWVLPIPWSMITI